MSIDLLLTVPVHMNTDTPLSWAMRGDSGIVQSYDTSVQPPKLVWTATLNDYMCNNISMKLLGGLLLCASAGQLYQLDATSGREIRMYELTQSLEAQYTCLAIYKHMAVSNSTHRLVSVSRDRFKKHWKSGDLGDRFEALEVVSNRLIVGVDGEVHVVDFETGQTIFAECFEGSRRDLTILGDELTDPERPVVYIGHCGKVYILDLNEKKLRDQPLLVHEDDSFGVALALHRGLLVATSGGVVTAFVAATLEEAWLHQFGHETGFSFLCSLHCFKANDKEVVAVGSNGYVVLVELKSGKELWMTSLPRGGYAFVSCLFADNVLYAASNGRMWSLDVSDGTVRFNVAMNGIGSHSPLLIAHDVRNNISSDTPILQAQGRVPSFNPLR